MWLSSDFSSDVWLDVWTQPSPAVWISTFYPVLQDSSVAITRNDQSFFTPLIVWHDSPIIVQSNVFTWNTVPLVVSALLFCKLFLYLGQIVCIFFFQIRHFPVLEQRLSDKKNIKHAEEKKNPMFQNKEQSSQQTKY